MKRATDPDTDAYFDELVARRDGDRSNGHGDHHQDDGDDTPPNLGWPDRLASSLVALSDPEWWTSDTGAEWLVEPIIPARRSTSITSAAKVGKSLILLEVAAALAAGRAIFDRPAGERVHVVYCDLEMSADDLRERLTDMDYGPDDDLASHLHYYSLPSLPALDTADGGLAICDIVGHHRAELVILDTTSRVIAGEENSADTFANYWRHTGAPLKAAGVGVVRLDHTGHADAGRARGSSAKAADVDLAWIIEPTDDGIRLRRTHQRIGWAAEKVTLRRHVDPLRHELVAGGWPAGTAEVARLLGDLGVPTDAPRRAAQALLKDAGTPKRAELVGAAQRYRRSRDDLVVVAGTTPGTTPGSIREPTPEPTPENPILARRNQARNHAGPLPESSGTSGSPRSGDHCPGPAPAEADEHHLDDDKGVF